MVKGKKWNNENNKPFSLGPYWKQRGRHVFMLQEAAFLPFYTLSLLSCFPLLSLVSVGFSQGQSDFCNSHSLPASLVLSCRLISGSSVIGLLANWPAGCQTQQRPSRQGHSGDCPPPLSKDSHQLPLSPSQHWLLLWRGCLSSRGAYTHTHTYFSSI